MCVVCTEVQTLVTFNITFIIYNYYKCIIILLVKRNRNMDSISDDGEMLYQLLRCLLLFFIKRNNKKQTDNDVISKIKFTTHNTIFCLLRF